MLWQHWTCPVEWLDVEATCLSSGRWYSNLRNGISNSKIQRETWERHRKQWEVRERIKKELRKDIENTRRCEKGCGKAETKPHWNSVAERQAQNDMKERLAGMKEKKGCRKTETMPHWNSIAERQARNDMKERPAGVKEKTDTPSLRNENYEMGSEMHNHFDN